jgi:branched-chain amino acid aminotransferase
MAMAELPEELFLDAIREAGGAIATGSRAIEGGSLYLRPFMIASEVFLGVKPASEYLYGDRLVGRRLFQGRRAGGHALGVGGLYRAAPGGTGAAKCGGNYAASLVAAGRGDRRGLRPGAVPRRGENRWIEELGGMNIFFVFDDGSLVTPPLGGTILPGITRDSILLTLARDRG